MSKTTMKSVIVVMALVGAVEWAHAEKFYGYITNVVDGDTVDLSTGTASDVRLMRVQVAGIDAPELDQPGGREAKLFFDVYMNRGQFVRAECGGKDRRGRRVCQLFALGGIGEEGWNMGKFMVQVGNAWVYRQYAGGLGARPAQEYFQAESQAMAGKKGLWADCGQLNACIPPWEWRKERKREYGITSPQVLGLTSPSVLGSTGGRWVETVDLPGRTVRH